MMKYYFTFKKSQEGIPTLIVYMVNEFSYSIGSLPDVVNVFTGDTAEKMWNTLTNKSEVNNNEK